LREVPIFHEGNVFSDYHSTNGFIDMCNAKVIRCFPERRETRWKVRVLFLFIFTIFHNSRMLYNLGNKYVKSKVWRRRICNELSAEIEYKRHKLTKIYKRNSRRKCHLCKLRVTNAICEGCNMSMCKTCYESSPHMDYVASELYKVKNRLQRLKSKEAPV